MDAKRSPLLTQLISSTFFYLSLLSTAQADSCNAGENETICLTAPLDEATTDYVLYFDQYLGEKFLLSPLQNLSDETPPFLTPVELTLQGFTGQLGNPDVSFDGKTIVFSAFVREDWSLYQGELDIANGEIVNITPLIAERGIREEDPRISWDSTQVVYKCNENVCVVQLDRPGFRRLLIEDICELYAPAFNPSGQHIAYTKRCVDEENDRIVLYDSVTGNELKLGSDGAGSDRFPHFLANGTLIYSHLDNTDGIVSLWQYDPQTPNSASTFFHDKTVSDDDSYIHKLNDEYIFFSGFDLNTDRYDLYVYRHSHGNSRQLSDNQSIIGAVIFTANTSTTINSGVAE